MARRRRSSPEAGFGVIILIIIAAIYNFYMANQQLIHLVAIIIGSIVVITGIALIASKVISSKKRKNLYISSYYFKETNYPYNRYLKEPGRLFEAQVFNEIRDTIGPDFPILTNVSLPQKDAFNIDSQIDLIVLHATGLYVIEVKDYSGPLIGRFDEDIWKPYVLKKNRNKKNNKFEDQYELNWGLYNSFKNKGFSNPIKQNEIHLRTVNQLVPAHYENIVIFSDKMFVSNENEKESRDGIIYSLLGFKSKLLNNPMKYSTLELNQLGEKLRIHDRQSAQQELLHKARLR